MKNKDIIKEEIIKERAINYIKNSPWFKNYHTEFKRYHKNGSSLEAYFNFTSPRNYITNAFLWDPTSEELDYWKVIDKNYLNFLDKLEEELTNKSTTIMEEKIIKFDLSKYRADSARYEVRNKKGNKMTILIDDLNDEYYKIIARNEETSEILMYNEKGRLFNNFESVNDLNLVEKNINKDKKKYYIVILKPLIPMPTEKNTSYISYMFSSKEEAQKAEGDSFIFKYIKTVEVEIDE